jgi:hypothetical protein
MALLACVLVWGALKLAVFTTGHIPISYVLPLLICVWTRRRWHLVALVAIFIVLASAKHFVVLPAGVRATSESFWNYFFSLFNIVGGAVIIALILRLRDALDARAEANQRQNAENPAAERGTRGAGRGTRPAERGDQDPVGGTRGAERGNRVAGGGNAPAERGAGRGEPPAGRA